MTKSSNFLADVFVGLWFDVSCGWTFLRIICCSYRCKLRMTSVNIIPKYEVQGWIRRGGLTPACSYAHALNDRGCRHIQAVNATTVLPQVRALKKRVGVKRSKHTESKTREPKMETGKQTTQKLYLSSTFFFTRSNKMKTNKTTQYSIATAVGQFRHFIIQGPRRPHKSPDRPSGKMSLMESRKADRHAG